MADLCRLSLGRANRAATASYDRIPFWHEPTYDLDNGSHVVDYGGDAPKEKGPLPWPAQLSRILRPIDSVPGGGKALEIRFPEGFPGRVRAGPHLPASAL